MRELVVDNKPIFLGRVGESEATIVVFDVAEWPDLYGDGGVFSLLVQRPREQAAYPVVIGNHGDTIEWTPQAADLAIAGIGMVELVYTIGETIAKSAVYATTIQSALDGTADVPAPWTPWVQTVLNAAEVAEDAMERAEDAQAASERAAASVHDYSYSDDGNGNVVIAIVEGE